MEYDFEIEYHKGEDMTIADFLSRAPIKDNQFINDDNQTNFHHMEILKTKSIIDKSHDSNNNNNNINNITSNVIDVTDVNHVITDNKSNCNFLKLCNFLTINHKRIL